MATLLGAQTTVWCVSIRNGLYFPGLASMFISGRKSWRVLTEMRMWSASNKGFLLDSPPNKPTHCIVKISQLSSQYAVVLSLIASTRMAFMYVKQQIFLGNLGNLQGLGKKWSTMSLNSFTLHSFCRNTFMINYPTQQARTKLLRHSSLISGQFPASKWELSQLSNSVHLEPVANVDTMPWSVKTSLHIHKHCATIKATGLKVCWALRLLQ